MAKGCIRPVLYHLRRAVLLRDGADMTDGQLLESFVTYKDEAAFEVLVRRHGPMVLGVCRRVLGNEHDAEDAFQATFLVLVRKAGSVVPRALVGNWLYGVAQVTARRAKVAAAKRARRERQVTQIPEPRVVRQESHERDSLQRVLDQELSRLPEKYRVPIILCDLQNQSIKRAARSLGWPQGTVAGRLARARTMLAKRLMRHGMLPAGGALAAVLSDNAVGACLSTSLVIFTVKAAVVVATEQGVPGAILSTKVIALMEGVLKTMLLNKLKTAMLLLVAVGVLGVGLGVSGYCYRAHAAEEKTNHVIPVASEASQQESPEGQPITPSTQGRPVPPLQKDYVMQLQLFETGPDGRVRAASPYHKHAIRRTGPETVTLHAEAKVHDFGETNGANIKIYESAMVGISYTLRLKELNSGHLLLDLLLKKDDLKHQEKDKDGILVWGRTLQILRNFEIGKLERFVLEKDDKGRPASWVEISVIRDPGDQRIPSHGPAPLPFPSRPNTAKQNSLKTELEGVWRPVRLERGGVRIREAELDKIGKLGIEGNKLFPADVSSERGRFDSIWHGWLRLDPGKKPKQMTIFDEGPDGELQFKGIYNLDGDDLVICINENGKDTALPDSFKTKEGSSFVFFHFKREKR
jgi:RNA polymerase sigma factor (sigma-70 family)